jgi:hypothetical protein
MLGSHGSDFECDSFWVWDIAPWWWRQYEPAEHRFHWLIDYDGVRLRLRTAATIGLFIYPPGDMWAWRAMVMVMMMVGDNSRLVHQTCLATLPAETSGAIRRNGRRSENFAYQYLKYLKGSLICRKILRHGTSGFTSHSKEGVLPVSQKAVIFAYTSY